MQKQMSESTSTPKKNFIDRSPTWKRNPLMFIIAILLIPLGIGVVLFFYARKKMNEERYEIHNDRLKIFTKGGVKIVSFLKIEEIKILQTTVQRWFKTCDISVSTHSESFILASIQDPYTIKDSIEELAAYLKELERKKVAPPKAEEKKVGGLEQLNDLVGLWQQGLLSDEDYFRERKKYE